MAVQAVRELYGILGDPVAHSLSPEIQAVAFALLSRPAAYVPFHVSTGDLGAGFAALRTLGVRGANITLPHKEHAASLVDALEGDAEAIRAVNVVALRDGKLVGFNTDTLAVTHSLGRARFSADGKRALVLGAGGAARAAAFALGKGGASEIIVANRNFSRARELSASLATAGVDIVPAPLSPAALREILPAVQLVVNATSVGLNEPDASPLPFDAEFDVGSIAIEMVYRPLKTRFLLHAREQGVQTVDGIDILVHQAIGSLAIWLNKKLDVERLYSAMRAAALEALL